MDERDDRLTTADIAERSDERGSARTDAGRPAPDEAELRHDQADERSTASSGDEAERPLLPEAEASRFRGEWESIQTGFVDEPRRAVERADALVAELMQKLAESFAEERGTLEAQWDRGDDISTEDLRVALQRYRSFFGRLLSA